MARKPEHEKYTVRTFENAKGQTRITIVLPIEAARMLADGDVAFYSKVFGEVEDLLNYWDATAAYEIPKR